MTITVSLRSAEAGDRNKKKVTGKRIFIKAFRENLVTLIIATNVKLLKFD
tara:strand:- start:118 stop:267 length:150 start_codon:yes stop_codon:yes gene_type:complete